MTVDMSTLRRLAALGCVLAATLPAACTKSKVGFEVLVPTSLVARAQWIELGAFQDASCAALTPLLADGVPEASATLRTAFRRDEPAPPALGALPRGAYALGAVARADDCTVLATGCVEVETSDLDGLRLELDTAREERGACGDRSACRGARCVPSVGGGCSLDLVGSGPLGAALLPEQGIISAPAIAETADGFLVAYREYDRATGTSRLTMLPIERGGGARPPARLVFPEHCPDADESDGTALALAGGAGFTAVTKAPGACNQAFGGIELVAVDAASPDVFGAGARFERKDLRVTLPQVHGLAHTGDRFLLATRADGVARLNVFRDARLDPSTAPAFGGVAPVLEGTVAASDTAIALLARAASGAAPVPGDAGADAGGDAGTDAGTRDASELRLQLVGADADLTRLPTPERIAARVGAAAVLGGRALVATDDPTGESGQLHVYDLGQAGQRGLVDLPGEVLGLGAVQATDVAARGDRAFVVVAKRGSLALYAVANAGGSPAPLAGIALEREPRLASAVRRFRDGQVALGASSDRVVVVFTSARELSIDDPTGSYAVFACQ